MNKSAILTLLLCSFSNSVRAQLSPAKAMQGAALTQRIGEQVPLKTEFVDETGKTVTLGALVSDHPAIILPVFYRCPMLCTQVLNALVRGVSAIDLQPGRDFDIVVFSFDPRETHTLAAEKKLNYLKPPFPPEKRAGWHFLVGKQDSIAAITSAIGYSYVYDATKDQFAHPAAAALITSDGRIARYVLGLDYSPRQLKLALLDAGRGKIGSIVDQIVLRCYAYDPQCGKYGFAIMSSLRAGGFLTVAVLIGAMHLMNRRWRRRPLASGGAVE